MAAAETRPPPPSLDAYFAAAEEASNCFTVVVEPVDGENTTISDNEVKNAVIILQEKYHLPIDGMENSQTLDVINARRCGVVDNFMPFMVDSSTTKWSNNTLTWYIYPPQYSQVAERAFSVWSKHANLYFIRSVNSPNISIAFVRGKHLCITSKTTYCYAAFDDKGGVLAHAEYPSTDKETAEIHFNQASKWHFDLTISATGNDASSLFWVLVHEIGHTLGLRHSNDRKSVLYPYYGFPNVSTFAELDLYQEEIHAIQFLYGKPLPPSPPPPPSTTTKRPSSPPSPPPIQPYLDVCHYMKRIDAFLVVNKRLFLFYRHYVWVIPLQQTLRLQRDYTHPMYINRWLKFLPTNFTRVSAIYQRPNNDIIMIANNQMYIFNYPHLHLIAQSNIHSVLSRSEGSGDVINAILHSNRGSTYIIYNRSFVNKVNECGGSLVTSTFIGDVSHLFPGIPRNVKTAFQHTNGRLYFKSNDLFYSYNDFIDSVSETIEDPSVLFNIVCNQNTILQQLQKLLNKLTMNLQLEEEAEEEEEEQE
uniref:ZnMc domain-containing protein n=1 Tax=Rhodnius prolixus TaxID=13249 RepID=T1HU38_RHOPR